MARVEWTNGTYNYEVDTDLGKTRITRVSDGQQQIRDATVSELQQAQAIVDAAATGTVTTLRADMLDAYQGLRAINRDRQVTWNELSTALPPALEVLRSMKDLGTQDLETMRYALVLVGEIIESTVWAQKDFRDKQTNAQTELIQLRQDYNALAARVATLEQA